MNLQPRYKAGLFLCTQYMQNALPLLTSMPMDGPRRVRTVALMKEGASYGAPRL
jgi:hypothetical protein